MKLLFLKNWENFPGHIIKSDTKLDVSNRIAKKLIGKGIARKLHETILPTDVPGYEHLIAFGINSIEKLMVVKNLISIPGIGRATKVKIKNYLEKIKY